MTKIDCIGDICPVPVIKTKKALGSMPTGAAFEGLEVAVDNDIAVQNISKLLNSLGAAFSTKNDDTGHFLIQITAYNGAAGAPAPSSSNTSKIIVIASNTMGVGDDVLGKTLLKGFLFAVTQQDTLPNTIIFYNSGVHLTLKNSESLKDLLYLQQQGVQIFSCGLCLKHYSAPENLAVGEVTDMYHIVNMMQQAGAIIKP